MALTPEQLREDQASFGNSFNEEDQAPVQQTDDDAFGLTPSPEVMEDPEAAGIPETPEEATEAPAEAQAEVTAGEEPGEPQQPPGLTKEEQRRKSWEGRQRAMGVDPAAEEQGETGDGDDATETPAQESAEPAATEIAEQLEEKLDSGMSPDEALKQLSADFGDEFAQMLTAVIDAKVAQMTGKVNQSVDEIINEIVDSKAKQHFETIADKHPDFMDVAASEPFTVFIQKNPDCKAIVENGSAREINRMLDAYKASQNANPDQEQDANDDVDAAVGVRSTGLRLPKQPAASNDYAAAWDEFND
jgi:hypothetical protein